MIDALIEYINTNPDWVKFINDAYHHRVVNNILMAVFSIATVSTLIFTTTTLVNKKTNSWYAAPTFVAFVGFAICMALMMQDRSELYKSWSVAML
ncbi:hypothetical protein GCM10009720_09040 [Yaniella flava]|uniref:Uncharacterized protein n=1 Tax=Yaniella flava TaxID=287930 RepID=A0ABP5FT64_9MICC